MKNLFELPDIPDEESTPLVKALVGIIEQLADLTQKQSEEIALLEDEIKVLKGEKKRPKFKPSKMDENTGKEGTGENSEGSTPKRSGSSKANKNSILKIDEDKIIPPAEPIPEGSRFKGYREFTVQDLVIKPYNTRYRLECWETPEGERLVGQLPEGLRGRHYGETLTSYILYQHHHCQVTQPLLLEQLREWGISISSGEIDRLLTHSQDTYHSEKDQILRTGLEISSYVSVDDSGARHKGKNGYVTQIGNDLFAWFESTHSKSRVNFLQLLRAGDKSYCMNDESFAYMRRQGLPLKPLNDLANSPIRTFIDATAWEKHLEDLDITSTRHRTIATEAVLLGVLFEQGLTTDLVILSDDAGQFNILLHALCWIHTERLIHTMIPLNEQHRKDIALVRGQLWALYSDLKAYKIAPENFNKVDLEQRFDELFTQRTTYGLLNSLLKRIHKNKAELLLVLDRPEIPLHTNGSETDIRDYVKKKKISGGTRSDLGRQCRDTFASLKKTCRKLGISFWKYLKDRESGAEDILSLSELMRLRAKVPLAPDY